MSQANDDPIDRLLNDPVEDSGGLGTEFGEATLAIFSIYFPYAGLAKVFYDQFSKVKRDSRIKEMLSDLQKAIENIKSTHAADNRAIQSYLEGPKFRQAFLTACEETLRATDAKKVKQFIAVLAGSVTPNEWSGKDEDFATLIRDLSQLGERDIQVLQVLSFAFKGLMGQPSSQIPEEFLFTNNHESLEREIAKQPLGRDDFYSTCCRLIGFGLAIEEPWPMTRSQPHGRCVRPTRRGLSLLDYLQRPT